MNEVKATLAREVAQKRASEESKRAMAAKAMRMMVNRSRLPNNSVNGPSARMDQASVLKAAGPSVSFKEIGVLSDVKKRKCELRSPSLCLRSCHHIKDRYMYEKISERSESL